MAEYPDFLEKDLAAILGGPGFGEILEFRPAEGDPVTFPGHFSAPAAERRPGDSATPVTAQDYAVTYQETALPHRLKRGDIVAARGDLWRVYKVIVDGQGLATASVQRAN